MIVGCKAHIVFQLLPDIFVTLWKLIDEQREGVYKRYNERMRSVKRRVKIKKDRKKNRRRKSLFNDESVSK